LGAASVGSLHTKGADDRNHSVFDTFGRVEHREREGKPGAKRGGEHHRPEMGARDGLAAPRGPVGAQRQHEPLLLARVLAVPERCPDELEEFLRERASDRNCELV
jgi:hypothetical protein